MAAKTSGRLQATRPTSARRPTPKATGSRALLDSNARILEPPIVTSPLSPADLEEFRTMLLEKRAQLVGDLGALRDAALRGSRREASGDLSSMPVHMADLGTDNYELEFTLGLLEGERALIQEIDEALQRIRDGTYGVCVATGRPIGKARLRAKPWAKYCYEYTLHMEKGKQPRF